MAGALLERQSVTHQEHLKPRREVLAYDIAFDMDAYQKFSQLQFLNPQAFEERKRSLDAYIERQLVTNLGERFNVLLSKTRYDIGGGKLTMQDGGETVNVLDAMVRGRNYRRKHGNPADFEREDAEILGMQKTEEITGDPETPPETMIVSISPSGGEKSIYKHNFYDVFTLKEEHGKRYVEARRYSSALMLEEYAEKINKLNPQYPVPFRLNAATLLANPFEVQNSSLRTASDVHSFLHKDHTFLSEKDFAVIDQESKAYRFAYRNILAQDPANFRMVALHFNAILNKADEIWQRNSRGENISPSGRADFYPLIADIYRLGTQTVRKVGGACGTSAGFDLDPFATGAANLMKQLEDVVHSPFSTLDFGLTKDDLGDRSFHCPSCGHKNIRPYNQKIKACQSSTCKSPEKVAC